MTDVIFNSTIQVNGVAFDPRDRMFLSSPNWNSKPKHSLYVVVDGKLKPYPTKDQPFSNVNSIHAYGDNLYVVDKNTIYLINTSTDKVTAKFPIKYSKQLNDIRVKDNNAYITDSGNGKVYQLDLLTGVSTTIASNIMYEHSSLGDWNIKVNADGIEITPDGKSLIITVPFGGRIRQINLKSKKVSVIGTLPPHGGIMFNIDGRLLYTDPLQHRVVSMDLVTGDEFTYTKDDKMIWPDAMVMHRGYIYFPAAKLTEKNPKPPYPVFKVKAQRAGGKLIKALS